VLRILVATVAALATCIAAFGGTKDSCGNPTAHRVGFMTKTANASDPDYMRRIVEIEQRFRDAVVKELPSDTCVISDMSILSDAKNFPLLKGTTVITVSAIVSFHKENNPNVAAIAIDIESVQGPSWDQSLHIATTPVLIESDGDYAIGAKGVIRMWHNMTKAIVNTSKQQ
jgi:hypothetical protein